MAWEVAEWKRKGAVSIEAGTMPCGLIIIYGQGTAAVTIARQWHSFEVLKPSTKGHF